MKRNSTHFHQSW